MRILVVFTFLIRKLLMHALIHFLIFQLYAIMMMLRALCLQNSDTKVITTENSFIFGNHLFYKDFRFQQTITFFTYFSSLNFLNYIVTCLKTPLQSTRETIGLRNPLYFVFICFFFCVFSWSISYEMKHMFFFLLPEFILRLRDS